MPLTQKCIVQNTGSPCSVNRSVKVDWKELRVFGKHGISTDISFVTVSLFMSKIRHSG